MSKGLRDIGQYKRVAASGNIVGVGGQLLRFICTTAGTLQITEGIIAGGADILSAIPVAQGTVLILNIDCPLGAWAVMTGGLIGTFVA